MSIIKSTTKQSAGEEIIFEFKDEGASVSLSSSESVDVLEVIAKSYFLENGTDIMEVEFLLPITTLNVGDCVSVIAPNFGVPSPTGSSLFVVTSVMHEFSELSATTRVKAKQYNF